MSNYQESPIEKLHLLVYKISFIQDLFTGDDSPQKIDLSRDGLEGLYFFLDEIKDTIQATYDVYARPGREPKKRVFA
ncbi:MAG: hypothetical protein N2572_10315 [Syntrophales bacterium]|nr:hypothetical protein [Syntrophales bacterium]